ncbi:hypothetical protein HY407_00570 [Candidatus Gottesmanbacteria bacterium]|nr:hypothetical protein [Candidatus Gottesmanbacteria bacterium]
MCRFLLVRSKTKINPKKILQAFTDMCEVSRDTDGDPQKDGWGVAWQEQGIWNISKSLNPIWTERERLEGIPSTKIVVAHARSASFPQYKGNVDYNGPYIHGPVCFVFNGRLYGVKIDRPLEGTIGAQKIFSLLQQEMEKKRDMEEALKSVQTILKANTRHIQGSNIGVVYDNIFYILCQYDDFPEYFRLHYYQDKELSIVCSEPILSYNWKSMTKGEVLTL